MRLLFDENLSPKHAASLRSLGCDTVFASEAGLAGAADPEVRAFAIAHNRTLITVDADFANILRYSPKDTPGTLLLRLHPPSEASIAGALERFVNSFYDQDLFGKLVIIDADKIRIRTVL